MPRAWSAKDERQYQHLVDSQRDRGRSGETAEEVAARTVNRIAGRSTMNKAELVAAIRGRG